MATLPISTATHDSLKSFKGGYWGQEAGPGWRGRILNLMDGSSDGTVGLKRCSRLRTCYYSTACASADKRLREVLGGLRDSANVLMCRVVQDVNKLQLQIYRSRSLPAYDRLGTLLAQRMQRSACAQIVAGRAPRAP